MAVIKTISFDQVEILQWIMHLYAPHGIDVDPTYGMGNFYKTGIAQPRYKFDIEPRSGDVVQADSQNLPLPDSSVQTINFDPPFIASWGVKSFTHKSHARFRIIKGMSNLISMYDNSVKEFARVLKDKGILIFKCQDTVYSARQHFNHIKVHDIAVRHGFVPVDLFVLLAKQRWLANPNQKTARKYHSYFWVFRKKSASSAKSI